MDLIVRNARLRGRETVQDVAVDGGRVVKIGAVRGRARHEIDVEGRLLTASFVNPHVHLISLILKNRGDHQPIPRGITRVKELLAAGVNVVFGQDDVLDPFYPFGRADMLEVASFTAHAAHLSLPEEIERVWDMATEHAAHALGVADHRLGAGLPANLVVVDAPTVVEALRRQGPRRLVVRSGRVVFESRTESRLIRAADSEPAANRAAREAR